MRQKLHGQLLDGERERQVREVATGLRPRCIRRPVLACWKARFVGRRPDRELGDELLAGVQFAVPTRLFEHRRIAESPAVPGRFVGNHLLDGALRGDDDRPVVGQQRGDGSVSVSRAVG